MHMEHLIKCKFFQQMSLRIRGIIYCTSASPVNFKLCLVEGNPVRNKQIFWNCALLHKCCF